MIFDRLLTVFKKIMPYADTAAITPKSALILDLHIDSVTLLMLVIAIEDEFGIRFDNLEQSAFNTVGDVVDYIQSKLN